MKKVFLGLMLAFSLIVSVTLTACGGGGNGGNGGGEQSYTTAQKEYNAFKDKALSIVDSYNLVISETTGASTVSSKTDEEETASRKALIKDIYETVSTNERSERVENFASSAKNFFKQIFVSPLVFGEVLTFNSNSATFYNTVGKASTADGNAWYVLKKNGDHTTFYSLDNTYQTYDGQKTGHIYYDLYYKSESDFNFLCITEISGGNFVFFSGDGNYNFAYVNYDVDSQSSSFVTVFDGVNALNIGGNSDFAKSCVDKVKNAQDMTEIRSQTNALSLSENPVTIDMNDFATVAKKYEDEIGNSTVNMSSGFEMNGDTLVGVRNYSKETLVIPKYVKSIDAQSFKIPANVKKLVVSENLKELVVKKYMLDYDRNGTSDDSTYVNCPFDFFDESKPFFNYNSETRKYDEIEISVLGNDGLFRQDDGGNVYLNLKPTVSSEERHDYILELKNMNYLAKKGKY